MSDPHDYFELAQQEPTPEPLEPPAEPPQAPPATVFPPAAPEPQVPSAEPPQASPTAAAAPSVSESAEAPARPTSAFDLLIASAPRAEGTAEAPVTDPTPTNAFFVAPEPGTASAAPTTAGSPLSLELRPRNNRRPRTSPIDWAALALAIVVPPLGIIAGVVALRLSARRDGWTSKVAKTATGLAIVLSLVAGAGTVVLSNIASDQAQHAAIVRSGAKFCSAIKADPNTLASGTFGWPAVQDSFADSVAAMEQFQATWEGYSTIAPVSVRPEVVKVSAMAKSIIGSIQASTVLDDASNVSTMRALAAASKIPAWMSEYCQ